MTDKAILAEFIERILRDFEVQDEDELFARREEIEAAHEELHVVDAILHGEVHKREARARGLYKAFKSADNVRDLSAHRKDRH